MCKKIQVFTCKARVSGLMRLYNEEWLQVREDGAGAGASGGNGLTGPLIRSDVIFFFLFFFSKSSNFSLF